MGSWAYYRCANGKVPYFLSVADAVGDADLALFLAMCANLAAGAKGPFVRYERKGSPLWSDVFPVPVRTLQKCIAKIFDEKPAKQETPLELIQANAQRNGPYGSIYHFYNDAILDAYTTLANGVRTSATIQMGNLWWTGPVDVLKTELVDQLRAAGLLGSLSDSRAYECLELVLAEQFRDRKTGVIQPIPDETERLRQYTFRRYTPNAIAGCPYNLLVYDAFWSAMRRIMCLDILRPCRRVEEKRAYKIDNEVNHLLGVLNKQGLQDEEYLRQCKKWCDYTGTPPTLDLILHPTNNILMQ